MRSGFSIRYDFRPLWSPSVIILDWKVLLPALDYYEDPMCWSLPTIYSHPAKTFVYSFLYPQCTSRVTNVPGSLQSLRCLPICDLLVTLCPTLSVTSGSPFWLSHLYAQLYFFFSLMLFITKCTLSCGHSIFMLSFLSPTTLACIMST